MNKIYFDNAATTKAFESVTDIAAQMTLQKYGNPSSAHLMGIEAERMIRDSRSKLGRILGVSPAEVFFTSGGTESNNLAIFGACRAYARERKHIITTQAEHPSVYECFRCLEEDGFDVTYLTLENGHVNIKQLLDQIRDDTSMISLMHVNNETGRIADIDKIGRAIKERNRHIVFHSDGVQGFCKIMSSLKYVDLYSISAHKIHGMKGVGALYVREGIRLKPLFFGGGQQNGLRPGTENSQGIVTFAIAAETMCDLDCNTVVEIKDKLMSVRALIDGVTVNSDIEGSPFILNMSFEGIKSETLVHAMAQEGVFISAGAACGSEKKGNRPLEALGIGKRLAESAVRFSFSYANTLEECERCITILIENVEKLRKANRYERSSVDKIRGNRTARRK